MVKKNVPKVWSTPSFKAIKSVYSFDVKYIFGPAPCEKIELKGFKKAVTLYQSWIYAKVKKLWLF